MKSYYSDPTPFFHCLASAGAAKRRMILISYHFPPGGAAGSLRWQKLSRFAADRGWELDVITVDPSSLSELHNERLADLPEGIRVFGVAVPELFLERLEGFLWRLYRRFFRSETGTGLVLPPEAKKATSEDLGPLNNAPPTARDRIKQRLRGTVRQMRGAYFAWMDYHIYGAWARDVARLGAKLTESGPYQVVVTCGPPHMAHEAGRRLAKESGIPLVIDLRDPWSLVQRLADSIDSPIWYRLAEFFEHRVVKAAALVVMNTERAQAAMQAGYPEKRDQIISVINGYDEEVILRTETAGMFIIAYAGVIYLDRDPTLIIRAVARLVRSLGLTPNDIGLEFMGHVKSYRNVSLFSLAKAEGIERYVRIHAPGSREQALQFLSRASVLLSLPQDSDMAIPSKVFEYMQFEAWVLCIAQRGSATELLLRGSDANIVQPDDVDGIAEAIALRFSEYQMGVRPVRLSTNMPSASRQIQAGILFDAIDRVVSVRAP